MVKGRRFLILTLFWATYCAAALPTTAAAEDSLSTTFNTPRFILHIGTASSDDDRLIYGIRDSALTILNDTYDELSRKFGYAPKNRVTLRLLPPDDFRKLTGAPAWTSAMFYRGEISVPLKDRGTLSSGDLKRALRHEYTHAVVAEISGFRCPAWLDEGIAQMIEGRPNPVLGPALRQWLADNEPMPLYWLQDGFTTLDNKLVPAAYAQSMFATRVLLEGTGMPSLVKYLELLKNKTPEDEAFSEAFEISKERFEQKLAQRLSEWDRSGIPNP